MIIEPTRFWATIAALLLLSGCSRAVKPCPVSGTVSVNGQPAGGVYVLFHAIGDPQKKQAPAAARTRADGSFSVRVPGPGEYAVTVFWPSVTIEAGEAIEGEDYFAGKHRAPESPVLKTTIQAGENVLPPIQLTYP